jgi:hypothetical protein
MNVFFISFFEALRRRGGIASSHISISCWMTLCERALQPLWGASMTDSFTVFQAAFRNGRNSNATESLQPLTPSQFEFCLADLYKKTTLNLSKSAQIGADRHGRPSWKSATQSLVAAGDCSGAALMRSLLQSLQTNPKLLMDLNTTGASAAVTAAAATSPDRIPHAPSSTLLKSQAAPPCLVPPLNISRIPTKDFSPSTFTYPTIPASPLTARSEWLRRVGETSAVPKPPMARNAVAHVKRDGAHEFPLSDSDAVFAAEQLLREKQQIILQPLKDSVAVQYRSLDCPSPDLGYRIEFNGSNGFNIHRPFDAVRVVSARSSRTILDRAIPPLSERQTMPRRHNHGQFITFREDFFDDDRSRSAMRSSGRNKFSACSNKSAASRSLRAKLDALENIALKALVGQPSFASRHVGAVSAAATASPGPTAQSSPLPPKIPVAAVSKSPLVRRTGLTVADNSMTILRNVVSGSAPDGKKMQ